MQGERVRIGDKSIEIQPRADDPDGKQLNALLNLHFACERARDVRVLLVHAVAFVSVLAIIDRIFAAFVTVGLHDGILLAWELTVLWTVLVAAFEGYARWRWWRSAAEYAKHAASC